MRPIERVSYNAQELMQTHPPVLRSANKLAVFHLACPDGARHEGEVAYSRWAAMALPESVRPREATAIVEIRPDVYDYVPCPDLSEVVEWHVNFADPHLFVAYGSSLFAQDEMQVAEHPALGALREALEADGYAALTQTRGEPTPVLVQGVERRCRIATNPDSAAGRPFGLYGNAFGRAPAAAVSTATTPLVPPTISNLIAMAAPTGGYGTYDLDTIQGIVRTACTGFTAAALESGTQPAVVHTGFWGCGAFGGNRVLMAALQVLAAQLAGLRRLVFHTFDEAGSGPIREALALLSEGPDELDTGLMLGKLCARGFRWGVSDGN